jgi:hypothetical protein
LKLLIASIKPSLADTILDKLYLCKRYFKRNILRDKKPKADGEESSSEEKDVNEKHLEFLMRVRKRKMKELERKKSGGIAQFMKLQSATSDEKVEMTGTSLNMMNSENRFRKVIFAILNHKRFD